MTRSKWIAVILAVSLAAAVTAIITRTQGRIFPDKQYSCQYLMGQPGYFISIKNLANDANLVYNLRTVKFPLIGEVNNWLYPLEYAIKHRLTTEDISDLIGKDFSVRIRPTFLLVTRTKREMNFFYYMRIRGDTEIQFKGHSIYAKALPQTGRSVYYAFESGYLLVTENLQVMKRTLTKRYPVTRPEPVSRSRFIMYDSAGASALNSFFRTRPICLYGDTMDSLTLRNASDKEDSRFDASAKCGLNLDIRALVPSASHVWGKFIVRDFAFLKKTYKGPARLDLDIAMLYPERINSRSLKAVKKWIMEKFAVPDQTLSLVPGGEWLVQANNGYIPALEKTTHLLSLDLSGTVGWDFLEPQLAELLRKYGKITVLAGQ